MWVKQCHKPSIWEWFTPPIYVDDWGIRWFILVLPALLLKDLTELMFGNPWKNMNKSRHRLNNILVHPWA
jgi:hypothetical protein